MDNLENQNYISQLDNNLLNEKINNTEQITTYFEDSIAAITAFYTKDITTLMSSIKDDIQDIANVSTNYIENTLIKLTNAIYFMGTNIEALGIRNDVAEALYKEVYNKEYLDQQNIQKDKKLTQATLQALADNKAMYENAVNSIYERAYKNVKFRIDSASDMCRVLSKLLSKRISEMSTISPDNIEGMTAKQQLFE